MSSTFEHLDIEFEEINKLGIAEIIALKGEGGVLSEQVKQTLLNCFNNVAWVDEHGQEYVDALRNALYPPPYLVRISAIYTQSGTIYPTDSLDDLREDLVVTATYSNGIEVPVTAYVLSGTLQVGESIITVSYGGKIAIFEVEVTRLAETYTITNSLTGASNSNSATYVTEGDSYSGTITANESHTLDGATISITMGGVDITSTAYDDGAISIDEVTGDLVITVVAVAIVLESISAVYTQSGTVYDIDSLDVLRTDLVVTAIYSDSSTETVPSTDYTLSGILEVGTSTIYVSYGGKTDSFSVTVTEHQLLPTGYTKYDYLYSNASSSTAGCYINTGVVFTNSPTSAEFTITFQEVSSGTGSSAVLVGVRQKGTGSTSNQGVVMILNNDHTTLRTWSGDGVATTLPTAYGKYTAVSTWTTSSLGIQYDDAEKQTTSLTTRQIDQYPICLFGLKHAVQAHAGTENFFKGKIYYAEVKQNGVKIMECYPCVRDSDSVAGMYDVVNEAFYTAYKTSSSYSIVAGNDT